MFTAGYNTAWGSLLEKQHPCQSKQQGGMCPPGDTAGGMGVCCLLPTSTAFGLMPGRTKPQEQEPKSCSPACMGLGQDLPMDPMLCSALAAEQPAACVTSQTSMVDGSNYRAAHS